MLQRLRELDGVVVFVIVTVTLTLICAALMVPTGDRGSFDNGAMLRASLIYVLVIGWQPIVGFAVARAMGDTRGGLDDGVRPVALRGSMVAAATAVFVLLVAAMLETMLVRRPPAPPVTVELTAVAAVRSVLGFVTVVAVLWLQAIVEELAWRGYVMPRLMRTLGPWPGLIVHGVVWGLCYAPLFAAAGGSVHRALGFVVTASLLGVVLGWLRLRTRSIFASAAANAMLTIFAGLPALVMCQGTGSRLSAAFEPPGWAALVILILSLLWRRRWRAAVSVPWRAGPAGSSGDPP